MANTSYHPMVYGIRAFHFVIGISMTAATGYLWYAALFGVFGRWTLLTLAALAIQWIVVALNHGHCPLGAVHHRYGDEKTLFELVAGKEYAASGFRNWGVICVVGLLLLSARVVFRF
jgi:hypothetical protein